MHSSLDYLSPIRFRER
ncbi:hypothetical protein ACQCVL_08285 [Bacillus thuringiensis]